MKIRLTTSFWKNEDHNKWKERYQHHAWITSMYSMIVLAWLILTYNESWLIAITSILYFGFSIIVILTYNRHRKEETRCKTPTTHNFKNLEENTKCKWCKKTVKEVKTNDIPQIPKN